MKKRDRDKLLNALDKLPERVAYLRAPILAIAKQDQDLLGCGEGDVTDLIRALRDRTGGTALIDEAFAAAEELGRWLQDLPDNNAAWAFPVSFAEGFLQGCKLYGIDEGDAKPLAPPPGLCRIEMDIPPEMKVKLYDGGIEMSNREVQIIVGELTEDAYQYKRDAYHAPLSPALADHPLLREERDLSFRLGSAAGIRSLSRNVQTGQPSMAEYVLERPTKMLVSMFARKSRGVDLSKYEQLLTTMRCK